MGQYSFLSYILVVSFLFARYLFVCGLDLPRDMTFNSPRVTLLWYLLLLLCLLSRFGFLNHCCQFILKINKKAIFPVICFSVKTEYLYRNQADVGQWLLTTVCPSVQGRVLLVRLQYIAAHNCCTVPVATKPNLHLLLFLFFWEFFSKTS